MKNQQIDKYLILETIGKGGMGEVYLAKNTGAAGISKFVALKKILNQYNFNPKRLKLFRNEAELAIKLNHSNIASIYEVGLHEKSLYIVMEYVPGTSLYEISERQTTYPINLSTADALHIAISILSGLSYAQRFINPKTQLLSPILHCDVCPQNVLVSFEGEIKLIDFGVAKVLGEENSDDHTDTIMGKVRYISPERAQGHEPDGRSDLFSTGVILWELLTGDRYYGDRSSPKIKLHLLSNGEPRALPERVPMQSQLQPILSKLLAPNPINRYKNAEEAEAALRIFFNKNFPEYIPSHFRDVIQIAFSDEIIASTSLVSGYLETTSGETAVSQGLLRNPKIDPQAVKMLLRSVEPPPGIFSLKNWNPTKSGDKADRVSRHHEADSSWSWLKPIVYSILLLVGYLASQQPWGREIFAKITGQFSSEKRTPASRLTTTGAVNAPALNEKKWIKVFVNSVPSGADIYLDGRKAYRRTPAHIPIEEGAQYEMRLIKEGFVAYSTKINSQSTPQTIQLFRRSR